MESLSLRVMFARTHPPRRMSVQAGACSGWVALGPIMGTLNISAVVCPEGFPDMKICVVGWFPLARVTVSSVWDMGAKQSTFVPFGNVSVVRNLICVASEFSEKS